MAKVSTNVIKEWFRNFKKPDQDQFWSWLDSFRHKDDKIPMDDVENLNATLLKKADLVGGVVPESQLPFTVNTDEVLAIGQIETTINNVKINVHESGSNKVRINGQILTRTFPSNLPFTAVTTGNKFLRIVARNETGLFFLKESAESDEPQEPALDPGDVHVRLILVTPDGSFIDPEFLNGFKSKSEDNWKTVYTNKLGNFIIEYNDERSCFLLDTAIPSAVDRSVSTITFASETNRDVLFILKNNTLGKVTLVATDTDGLTKAISSDNAPYSIKSKSSVFVKYSKSKDVLEILNIGNNDAMTSIYTDASLEGLGIAASPLKLSTALKTEIANNTARTSSVTDLFVHYWDATVGKWLSSGLKFVSGTINQLEFAGRIKADAIILPNNANTAIANRLRSDGSKLFYANNSAVEKEIAFVETIYEHQIRGKVLTVSGVTGTYNCDLNSYTRWILTLTGNTTIAFTNMIADNETITISMNVTGNFTLSFPSWLKISPYSDAYDGTKVNRIVIEIGKGGVSPSGWYNIIKFDS